MKKYIAFLIPFFALMAFIQPVQAQKAKKKKVEESSFTVKGNCGMCKERIENAALIKGVKKAEWDEETQKLTVIYKVGKVSLEQINEAVAEKGHETETVKANETAYKNLAKCCQYKDQKCDQPEK